MDKPAMVTREDWSGVVGERPKCEPTIRATAVIPREVAKPQRGASRPVMVRCSDDAEWWLKPLENQQGPRVPITEQVVAATARLIGGPVCETALIEIPEELEGLGNTGGPNLKAGIAHGSKHVPDSTMKKGSPAFVEQDDNARRHAGVLAIYDWCWGDDAQWLYNASDDHRLFSHDHGNFLPPGGRSWAVDDLVRCVDQPHTLAYPSPAMLDRAEVLRLAEVLENLEREQLAACLRQVPPEWPVESAELEVVGFFLERRAPQAAARLRAFVGGTGGER